jgi:YD repeat-containing protein
MDKVCVDADGKVIDFFDPRASGGPRWCYTCKSWLAMMIAGGYYTAGDPTEDGDAAGNHPGYWLNYDANGRLVERINKQTCYDLDGVTYRVSNFPRMEERLIPCPTPSPTPVPTPTPSPTPVPTPTPSPGPTPTPGPGGCPALYQVGGSLLAPRDCGESCRKQGYLGYVVNYTATELCEEGKPGCVCDPARNRCERPKECQDPRGATVYITHGGFDQLGRFQPSGKFTNDLCDERSDNPFNCHHKPKADETGITEFRSCPWNDPLKWDHPACVANYVDVQKSGPKMVPRPKLIGDLSLRNSSDQLFNDPPARVYGRRIGR